VTIRGIRSEVEVGPQEELPETSVIICDSVLTIPQSVLDPAAAGHLDEVKRAELNRALRYALDSGTEVVRSAMERACSTVGGRIEARTCACGQNSPQ
jgi:hypothetical protein